MRDLCAWKDIRKLLKQLCGSQLSWLFNNSRLQCSKLRRGQGQPTEGFPNSYKYILHTTPSEVERVSAGGKENLLPGKATHPERA